MSENGESKKSLTGEALSLLEDQMELASLEWQYEKKQSLRRIGALIGAVVLGITAFAFLQVAIVLGLVAKGLSLTQACLVLAGVYAAVGAVLFVRFGKRDERAGEPFQGTRQELHKNIQWIRNLFS